MRVPIIMFRLLGDEAVSPSCAIAYRKCVRIALVFLLASIAASFVHPVYAQRGLEINAKQLEVMRTEKRVALVIGNSNYATSRLRNPVNDARAMSIKLHALGFEVIERLDIDQRSMKLAMINFGKKLKKGGVGLFYYAGHGVQYEGNNYLIPVGARIDDEEHVEIEGVSINQVLKRMGSARNRLNLVILDSCRNNPYAAAFRSETRGLTVTSSPKGTYISYAAAPGAVAADGKGKHSPYTQAILDNLDAPGVKIEELFKRVRVRVSVETNGKQLPYTESSLIGDFYFRVPGNDPKQQIAAIVTVPKVTPSTPSPATPAVGVYPTRYKPGDTFKDCDECPEMVVISAGRFMMGSPASEPGRDKEEGPQRRVTISKPFAVGKFEVTQAEWRFVLGANPSQFRGDRNPVEMVSWDDAEAFVKNLSSKTGRPYRLLSEAEWEYAARSGATTPFHTGNRITLGQANFNRNYTYSGTSKGDYLKRTVAVGSFAANNFGLHDMHGNVWEWVEDCWRTYQGSPKDGGVSWGGDYCERRVLRGGSWFDVPRFLRAAHRFSSTSGYRDFSIGVRVARDLSQ
jgi:formylglycine-generating enzyme required for sulfatase activity